MRIWIIQLSALLLTLAAVSAVPAFAQAAGGAEPPRADLVMGYSYLHSNAPPGGCGCFNLNGGNVAFAWRLKAAQRKSGSFALMADVTAAYVDGISASGYNLTLSTYTVGTRYETQLGHSRLQPFGQVLVGLAHVSGSLVDSPTFPANNASVSFASIVGGGFDLRLNRRFSIRLADVDYLLTTVDNGSKNHQNNLRAGAGIGIHF